MNPRRHHDMGGLEAGGLDLESHVHEPWEKRTRVLYDLLVRKHRLLSTDEMRRGIEDLGAVEYEQLTYYERWIASITRVLIEKGIISVDELGRKMAEVERRWLRARTS